MSDAKFQKLAQEETLKDEMRYKEGYELDKLTVKDASGNKLKLTDKGNGKYTFKEVHWNAMQACSGESMPESEQ